MKLTLTELDSKILQRISSSRLLEDSKRLKDQIDRDSTLYSLHGRFANEVRFLTRTLRDLEFLAIVSWYIDETVGFLIRLKIREIASETNGDLITLRVLTDSKEICLAAIAEDLTLSKNLREFFGNCLNESNISRFSRIVKLKYLTQRKPARKVYRRGPTDQGSLGSKNQEEDDWLVDPLRLYEYELSRCLVRKRYKELLLQCYLRIELEVS